MQNPKKVQPVVYYAKIMIAISIALLTYGIILDIQGNHHLIDPVKDVIPFTNDNPNNVTISTIDHEGLDQTPTESIPEETKDPIVSVPSDDTPITTVPNNPSNPPSTVTSESSSQQSNHTPVEPKIPTIDEVNDQLRKEIENSFGVSIRYGEETNGYYVLSGDVRINTEPITNSTTINSQLTRLKNALSVYPTGMFREIRDGGIPLTIILIDRYSQNTITGITDSNYTYANISISAAYPFEESFYHESYHYIERYLFKKGANYNGWDLLNPDGFTYGTIYNDLSYANTFSQDAPFVNNYAQTADTEDRASTFEYMMAPSKASCLNNGTVVWTKAKYMARTMETILRSVNPSIIEYWERFL